MFGDYLSEFPLVSIIILNYNGKRYLGNELLECLDSVFRSDYPNFEVIFVDNGSDDNSIEFIGYHFEKYRLRIIRNETNLGWSGGFNRGVSVSFGDYVVLLSNDMIVDPNWLKPVVKLFQRDSKVGLIGFKRLLKSRSSIIDGIGGDLYLNGIVKHVGSHEVDRGQFDRIIENLDFVGGAMAVRKTLIEKIGLFDPSFMIFSEDVDLCFRVRRYGYKVVYVYKSIIWHKRSGTINKMDSEFVEFMLNKNRVQFCLKHFTFMRILGTLLMDIGWLFFVKGSTKIALLKAYRWNLVNIGGILLARLKSGPSPPLKPKFPVTPLVEMIRGIYRGN